MYIIISRVATQRPGISDEGFIATVRSMNSRAWVRDGAEFSEVRGKLGTYFWEIKDNLSLNNISWISFTFTIKPVYESQKHILSFAPCKLCRYRRLSMGTETRNEPQKRESSTFCRKSEVWINKNKPDKQNNLIQVNKLNKVEYDISPEQ